MRVDGNRRHAGLHRQDLDRPRHPRRRLERAGSDRLAVAGTIAARRAQQTISSSTSTSNQEGFSTRRPFNVPVDIQLTITAINGMIWIDNEAGSEAWVIQQYGVQFINKNDTAAPTVNAQGEITNPGSGAEADPGAGGNAPGADSQQDHQDHDNIENPPVANPDSVTARAGDTVTIPVTANDWDPDGEAIAVVRVGDKQKATHGTADVLDGTSVTYVPNPVSAAPTPSTTRSSTSSAIRTPPP